MADTTALKNRIRAAIKANDNQEITGPVLQQSLLDIVDELNGATETEAQQRQSGDNTLQQSINTERQRAQEAEGNLGQRITQETQRAQGIEQNLQRTVTKLESKDGWSICIGDASGHLYKENGTLYFKKLQIKNINTGVFYNITDGTHAWGENNSIPIESGGAFYYITADNVLVSSTNYNIETEKLRVGLSAINATISDLINDLLNYYEAIRKNDEVNAKAVKALKEISSLELEDVTGSELQLHEMSIALRTNEGSEEDPDILTLDTITIPSATDQKAGLVPAKNTWDEKPTSGSKSIVGSSAIAKAIANNADKINTEAKNISFSAHGQGIATNGGVGSVVDINNPVSLSSMIYAIADLDGIQRVRVKGYGGQTCRLWCFIDVDNKIISVAEPLVNNSNGEELILDVPEGATKVIVNCDWSYSHYLHVCQKINFVKSEDVYPYKCRRFFVNNASNYSPLSIEINTSTKEVTLPASLFRIQSGKTLNTADRCTVASAVTTSFVEPSLFNSALPCGLYAVINSSSDMAVYLVPSTKQEQFFTDHSSGSIWELGRGIISINTGEYSLSAMGAVKINGRYASVPYNYFTENLVNNCHEGGTNKALAAEQGKFLQPYKCRWFGATGTVGATEFPLEIDTVANKVRTTEQVRIGGGNSLITIKSIAANVETDFIGSYEEGVNDGYTYALLVAYTGSGSSTNNVYIVRYDEYEGFFETYSNYNIIELGRGVLRNKGREFVAFGNIIIDNVKYSCHQPYIDGSITENVDKINHILSSEITDPNILNVKDYYIGADGKFGTSNKHACVAVTEGEMYFLIGSHPNCRYAFATSDEYTSGGDIPLVSGTSVVRMGSVNTFYTVIIPENCNYLLFNIGNDYGTRCYKFDDDIVEEMKEIKDSYSLANYSVIDGYLTQNGTIQQSTGGRGVTGLIPISKNTNVNIRSNGVGIYASNGTYVAYYDSNFSFISTGVVPLPGESSPLLDNFSFVVPDNSNIAFMRLNIAVNAEPIVINYDGIDLFSIIQEKIEINYNVKNAFKTIGVFGGSFSVISESNAAKKYWKKYLRCTVTNYGEGGAGYSSLQKGLQGHSIQDQVDGAGVHDIYILWASTNDFTNSREIGTYSDYTAIDNYDDNKLVTQCGGINYCIKKLFEKNPKAEIYLFTSLRFFTRDAGYNPFSTDFNSLNKNFADYIEGQKKCCEYYGIPVLDMFNYQGVNIFNYTQYYQNDHLHMNAAGYDKIGRMQAQFLANGK